jgi:hypothetical protein
MSHAVNFLHKQEPEPVQESHQRRRWWHYIAWGLAGIIVVWVVVLLLAAGQVLTSALDARSDLESAREAALDLQFDEARDALSDADQALVHAEAGYTVLRSVAYVPWVGDYVETVGTMLDSGHNVISAVDEVVEIGAEVVRISGVAQEDITAIQQGLSPNITFEQLSTDKKRTILKRLSNAAGDFRRIEAKIAVARSEINELPTDNLVAPIANEIRPLDDQLAQLEELVGTMSLAANLLPQFAGLDEQRTFLLLFLNNAELRPGGGFIGTYGTLTVKDGELRNLRTRDVYHLDDAAEPNLQTDPPQPFTDYLGLNTWFMRDANWSPDFAVSSRQTINAFLREIDTLPPEQREEIQSRVVPAGVIGFTPDFASDVLRIVGPVEVRGQRFTAENVFDTLEYQVEFGFAQEGLPPEQRKEIVSELVREVRTRVFALPLSELSRIVDAARDNLNEKQIALYSADSNTQKAIERAGWGGRVHPGPIDTQLWVDANLGALKSDHAVDRTITYEIIQNTDGEFIGRTKMLYNHTGTFDWKTTRYRTYARLYVPKGSEFIRARGTLLNDKTYNPELKPGPVDVGEDLGMTTFGAFTAIEPGQQRELVFEYKLADSVVEKIREGTYALDAIKQIGADAHALTLSLDFDKNITYAEPAEGAGEWGDDMYRLNTKLNQDKTFSVSF